jgi:hypothetical protein
MDVICEAMESHREHVVFGSLAASDTALQIGEAYRAGFPALSD